MPDALPIPNAASGAYSPDGRRIAYNPLAPRFEQWKQYRGGTVSRIWLYDTRARRSRRCRSRRRAPTTWTRCGLAASLYFRSDRDGEFNLFSYDAGIERGRSS